MGQFDKFKKEAFSGAKKKEMFKQEKRKTKAETEAFFKSKKREARPAPGIPAEKVRDNQQKTGTAPAKSPSYAKPAAVQENMALNKYISHSGICSRREAADRIKAGEVMVNGEVQVNPAYKVLENDIIKFNGKKVTPKQQMVYILLNKPKDFITTAEDDKGRKTVLDIVKNATDERIFPVGRLDRNTTGVLLLTNDGELTQQLTHPSFEVRKIYEVTLDKPVIKADLEKLLEGVVLEDGPVHADAAGYADARDKSVVGVEIHSGKNRVVRRMFEHLGYDVRSLDRVMFANLTKKGVDRGKWRFLSEKEVRLLKFFNKSKRKSKSDSVELQDVPYSPRPAAKRAAAPAGKDYAPAKRNAGEGHPAEKRERAPFAKKQEYTGAKREGVATDKREKPSYDKREKPSFDKREKPSYDKREKPSYDKREKPSYDKREKPPYEKRANQAEGKKGGAAPRPRPASDKQGSTSPLQQPDGKRIRKRIPLK